MLGTDLGQPFAAECQDESHSSPRPAPLTQPLQDGTAGLARLCGEKPGPPPDAKLAARCVADRDERGGRELKVSLNGICLSSPAPGSKLTDKHFVNAALDSSEGGPARFPTSQWSLVAAASAQEPKAKAALEGLYCLYCYPVYAFIRRRGYARQDAQDLTQYFFVHLLEKATLGKADPQRGRFRSFLLGALGHFLAHADERARAQKRGGGVECVSLDIEKAESGYEVMAPDDLTPEKVLDKRWAVTLNEVARERLHQEMEAKNKRRLFETLQGFVLGEENASYQEVADRLGVSLNGLKTHIYRLRNRYGELLREEVARTVARPEEVDEELRYLIGVLRR